LEKRCGFLNIDVFIKECFVLSDVIEVSMRLMWLLLLNKVTFDVSVTLEQCPQEQADYQKRSVYILSL